MPDSDPIGDRFGRFVTRFLPVVALLAAAGATHAGSLQVAPVTLGFGPQEQARVLYLDNHGGQPLEAQVRVQRWSQHDGQDRLEPTGDIVATPAIVMIAPGERPTVRLVRRQAAPPAREESYRVLVNELPRKRDHAADHAALHVLLGYSIPLFVAAVDAPRAPASAGTDVPPPPVDLSGVRARLVRGADGRTVLRVANDGAAHVRIGGLAVQAADGSERAVVDGLVGYVLPGQQVSFPVDLPDTLPAGQTLKARFNDDREARPVPLDRAGS